MCVCARISRWRSLKRPHRRFRTGSRPSSSSIDLASISIRKWGRDEGKSNIRDAQFVIPVAEHPRKFVVLDSLENFNFSICEKIFRGGGKRIHREERKNGGEYTWRRLQASIEFFSLKDGGIDAWRDGLIRIISLLLFFSVFKRSGRWCLWKRGKSVIDEENV